ncbi:hypothetical protein Tco_0216297 [Tanacetum coccineum]
MLKRVEYSDNEESLGKDASKQGRIDAIDADEEITLVSVQNVDEEMFDVNVLDGEEVFVAREEETLMEITSTRKPEKGGRLLSRAWVTSQTTISSTTITDKGKGILIEPVKPMKKKDLIRLDEEVALNFKPEFLIKKKDLQERKLKKKKKPILP